MPRLQTEDGCVIDTPRSSIHNRSLVGIFRYYLLVIGLGLIGFGCRLLWTMLAFRGRCRQAQGRLTGWKDSRDLKGRIYYYAQVEFEDREGITRIATGSIGHSPKPKSPLGKRTNVLYDPANSEDAHIDSIVQLWAAPAAFFVIGGAALLAFLHPK